MGATTIGALIGGAVDSMSGDDGTADGAIIGAVTANVLKIVLPIAVTYAVGWGVLRALGQLRAGIGVGRPGVIGKIVGALFGAEVERSRGQSGVKGAALGVLATSLVRRMGPLGLLIGGAYVAKKALDRRREAKDGDAPTG